MVAAPLALVNSQLSVSAFISAGDTSYHCNDDLLLDLQALSEVDLEDIEEGSTERSQNVMSVPIDNSNDENDIDEETM